MSMHERTKNILYLFQERQEDEAERDEAALRTMISADDGGDVSRRTGAVVRRRS